MTEEFNLSEKIFKDRRLRENRQLVIPLNDVKEFIKILKEHRPEDESFLNKISGEKLSK